jgi:hypothetical protein
MIAVVKQPGGAAVAVLFRGNDLLAGGRLMSEATARPALGKTTDGIPTGRRLLVSTVPVPPMKALAFGCSVGGGQVGLVASLSPGQVEAATSVTTWALVSCAWLPLPKPSRPPLTCVQLLASPKASLVMTE